MAGSALPAAFNMFVARKKWGERLTPCSTFSIVGAKALYLILPDTVATLLFASKQWRK
jgi:hypothetical protein